ncbi:hypothetical protein [Prochlorococcus marinus]|uniref:hypothetical protein n=1 Tax=Prochlorococcus marinus TaxID=1219 RepID=UPI0022B52F69|nr:hypothetical protein [Prochlorococcus marinus]
MTINKILKRIINVPLNNSRKQQLIYIIKWMKQRLNSKGLYITERYRIAKPHINKSSINDKTNDVAILMRGPIVEEDDFTINTLKYYRSIYPEAPIYLSTWDHCLQNNLQSLKKININIISSQYRKPSTGFGNMNLQIIGNKNGMVNIIKHNIKYTLTTRTDQRFYSYNVLKYLKEIHALFDDYSNDNNEKDLQIKRLIGLSFNTFLYRIYGLSDMFLFGLSNDVHNYWDSDYDKRIFKEMDLEIQTQKEWSEQRIYECYFMTEFLKRNGHQITWRLDDYWKILRERFIIIDSSALDFFWPKYSHLEERWKNYNKNILFKEITNSDWLLLKNFKLELDEEITKRPFNAQDS